MSAPGVCDSSRFMVERALNMPQRSCRRPWGILLTYLLRTSQVLV